jgi:ABC-2 type transport system ATP-binding protein
MIEAENLTKRFGHNVAVDHLSFQVAKGEVLGFLGPNGAGKSTTMKMVTGFLTPDEGSAVIQGFDIQKNPLAAKALIGYLPEGAPAYPDMEVADFLHFIVKVRGLSISIDKAVSQTGLQKALRQPIDTLSKGFKRRVGLAAAILPDPPVLIMDEPTDGLDPNQKHHVRNLIQEMAQDKAIIISTHILEEVDAVCSRAVIIDQGRICADGTPKQLLDNSDHDNLDDLFRSLTKIKGAA